MTVEVMPGKEDVSLNQTEKSKVVEALTASVKRSRVAVVTHYRGLTVGELTEFRRKCRAVGVEYRVVKNTLARRAVQGSPFAGMVDLLGGPAAVAFSADPAAPSKVLEEFIKTHPKMLVVGGVLEGQLMDAKAIMALAQLPSREVLLGRLLATMMGPLQGLVTVLNAVPAGLVRVLDQVRCQKEEEAAA